MLEINKTEPKPSAHYLAIVEIPDDCTIENTVEFENTGTWGPEVSGIKIWTGMKIPRIEETNELIHKKYLMKARKLLWKQNLLNLKSIDRLIK